MIEIVDLKKSFKNKEVLKGISLTVKPGDRVALVGHNGSGKTTFIRCLLGLHLYSGTIRVNGRDPAKERLDALREIGFVPQMPPGLRMTVGEFVQLLCALCHLSSSDVESAASHLNLDLKSIWKTPFLGLSGGMKQKLLIAAALIRRPAMLILDEPTANLDPAARSAFFDGLRQLSPETVLLISSHRIDELAGLVTRLIELDDGHLVRDEAVQVLDAASGERLQCRLVLHEDAGSIIKGLQDWGLKKDGSAWRGTIDALDRFRFIADIARWSGAVQELSLGGAEVSKSSKFAAKAQL